MQWTSARAEIMDKRNSRQKNFVQKTGKKITLVLKNYQFQIVWFEKNNEYNLSNKYNIFVLEAIDSRYLQIFNIGSGVLIRISTQLAKFFVIRLHKNKVNVLY